MTDELEKRPTRALKELAFRRLVEDDRIADLLPDDDDPEFGGVAVVQKPTSIDDDDLAAACIRVAVASDASMPRGTINEHTQLLQIQIDWTRDWHRSEGPDWEDDIRDAISDALSRMGGKAITPLGSGGDTAAVRSDTLDRYQGDMTFRYRTVDVREASD